MATMKKTKPSSKKGFMEKKTGEMYKSKSEMAKHEKSEPRKVRIAEGELPKKKMVKKKK